MSFDLIIQTACPRGHLGDQEWDAYWAPPDSYDELYSIEAGLR